MEHNLREIKDNSPKIHKTLMNNATYEQTDQKCVKRLDLTSAVSYVEVKKLY